jgi:hypothetical protein
MMITITILMTIMISIVITIVQFRKLMSKAFNSDLEVGIGRDDYYGSRGFRVD